MTIAARRQAALASYAILDTESDAEFDQIVAAAAAACGMPVSLISLLDGDRQWFKAEIGFGASETPLASSICALTVRQSDAFVIPDTTRDPRTAGNPLVTRAPHVRFYAGVPLEGADGVAIGALCVLDTKPNRLNASQTLILRTLARQAMTALELRRTILRRSEGDRRNKAILDSAIDYAIVALDLAGHVTSWNTGAEKILGWSEAEMLGQPAHRFFTERDVGDRIPEKEMREALARGRAADERWHLRKDGTRFWANGEMMPLTDADGNPDGFIKILRDRTEQRDAAARQQADAAFMRSVLASSADCIKVLDLDAKLTFMNEGGMRVMEVSDFNNVKGCPWPDFWQGQGNLDAVAALDAARAGGTGHFQGAADTYAGTPKWWDVQVTSIRGPDGMPSKLLAVSRDISDLKTVQGNLAASEARWRGLFDGMREGFFLGELVRDGDGRATDYRFLEINPAFARQSGLPLDSIGRTIRSFVPDIDQSLIDRYARVVETGEPVSFEMDVPGLNRSFEVRASKERDDRFSCLFLDITTRRRADARRAAMTELGDNLRDAATVLEMTTKAAEIVGRTLGGSRAGYGEMDAACEHVTILWDGVAPGEVSIVGRHRFADYGAVAPDIERGDPVIVHDVSTDPRTAEGSQTYDAIDLRAMINVPVQEHGRTVGLIFVHSPTARAWEPDEVAFARDVADRVQVGIAQLRAEQQLTRAREQLRLAIVSTGIGVFDYDPLTGALVWDARARAMFGMTPDEDLTYATFLAAVHPDERDRVDASIRTALDPEGDGGYDITYRTVGVRDGLKRWVHGKGQAFAEEGQVVRFIGTMRDVTEIKAAEEQQVVLNHELSHRMKNMLAMVQSIASQTLRNAANVGEAREALASRLVALGKAHDILLEGRTDSAPISVVVDGALVLHQDGGNRFRRNGPDLLVGPSTALSLGLILHELATNATKYGALRDADGYVDLTWRVEGEGVGADFHLAWTERGGPVVTPPSRKGFGSRLIQRGLSGGNVETRYPPEGVVCTLTTPLASLEAGT